MDLRQHRQRAMSGLERLTQGLRINTTRIHRTPTHIHCRGLRRLVVLLAARGFLAQCGCNNEEAL